MRRRALRVSVCGLWVGMASTFVVYAAFSCTQRTPCKVPNCCPTPVPLPLLPPLVAPDDLLDDDMLSGDEEEGREGGLSARRRGRGAEQGPSSEEEGGSEDEEGGSSDEDLLGGRGGGGGGRQRDLLDESGSEDEEGEGLALSAHELRQQRMADRIRWVGGWAGVGGTGSLEGWGMA